MKPVYLITPGGVGTTYLKKLLKAKYPSDVYLTHNIEKIENPKNPKNYKALYVLGDPLLSIVSRCRRGIGRKGFLQHFFNLLPKSKQQIVNKEVMNIKKHEFSTRKNNDIEKEQEFLKKLLITAENHKQDFYGIEEHFNSFFDLFQKKQDFIQGKDYIFLDFRSPFFNTNLTKFLQLDIGAVYEENVRSSSKQLVQELLEPLHDTQNIYKIYKEIDNRLSKQLLYS